MPPPTLLCVVGPTACGKTRMGIALAQRFHGEIISVDSMQIYKGMSTGTAAPTPEEQNAVPHHMVGIAEPGESWSVARFSEAAGQYIRNILARGKLPLLVGGTGLYLEAIVTGRSFAPGSAGGQVRQALERELAERGGAAMLEELRQIDPEAAGRLHPRDEKRILRALEVYRETGRTITEHNRETRELPMPYRPLYIGLTYAERADLWEAIDRRVDAMLEAGLVREVQALLDRGVPRDATAFQAIGYKELLAALDGEQTMEQAAACIKLRSRQYAKRQMTWLRRIEGIHWIYWNKKRDFAPALQNATEYLIANGLQ